MCFENTESSLFAQFSDTSSLRQTIWTNGKQLPRRDSGWHTAEWRQSGPLIRSIRPHQLQGGEPLGNRGIAHHGAPCLPSRQVEITALYSWGEGKSLIWSCASWWFQLILVCWHAVSSQGSTKNPHSLCKLSSSGHFWPDRPGPLFFPDSDYTSQHRTLETGAEPNKRIGGGRQKQMKKSYMVQKTVLTRNFET